MNFVQNAEPGFGLDSLLSTTTQYYTYTE